MTTGNERTDALVALLGSLLGKVETRAAMGAVGITLQGVLFGLISDGSLFFRVDGHNRADYDAFDQADDGDFIPAGVMPGDLSWRRVPPPVLTDSELLRRWALKAWEAGKRARKAAG